MTNKPWTVVIAAALLAGCAPVIAAPPVPPPVAVAPSADEAFARLGDRWLAETLRLNPVAATQAGEHRYDSLLPNITADGRAAQLQLTKGTLAALEAIDRTRLS